ncbi:MT-A70 family methyltransferase (plasmid) [Bradyrhizobium oligotrophicum S58]
MTTVLQAYDRACAALAEASTINEVLAIRDEMAHVKLYAQRVQDRALIERAMVLQLRAERRLGFLLGAAFEAGQLARGRKAKDDGERFTLEDIGVSKSLSSLAQRTAALDDDAFEELVEATRERIRARKAIVVDPVKEADKAAEIEARRAAHAARTKGGCSVKDLGALALTGWRARFCGMDPQWHFITRSEAGQGRSANVYYKTEEVEKIKAIPVGEITADDSCLAMWMVDWCPRDALELGESYGFTHITTLYTWVKTNGDRFDLHDPATCHLGMGYWSRANPEDCWLFTKGDPSRLYADVRQLIFAPLMEHSRKPDEWLTRSERLVEGPYLELNARRRRPGWVAWGDELEWEGPEA